MKGLLFKTLNETIGKFNDDNACGLVAVCAATDIDYETVYNEFKKVGRPHKGAVSIGQVRKVFKALGFGLELISPYDIIDKYPAHYQHIKSVTPKHIKKFPQAFRDKIYVIFVRQHVYTVKNSEVIDWSHNRSFRSNFIYEVEKIKE